MPSEFTTHGIDCSFQIVGPDNPRWSNHSKTTCSMPCPRQKGSVGCRSWSPCDMPLGSVLYEPGVALSHVYFPTTAIVSLLYVMENGASAEIAVVGNEGVVGISLFMGGESTPSRAVVQSAGIGLRLRAPVMKEEFNRAGPYCISCCATPRR